MRHRDSPLTSLGVLAVIHTDARFSSAVAAAVGEVEAGTDAELVVVAAPQSGSYADLAALGGGLAGLGTLAFLCWSPIAFDAMMFPVECGLVGAFVGAVLRRPAVRFAGEARRRRQVREAAFAAFAEENVHATANRTGVLVYVSAAEGRVELVPDQGLLGRIPGAEWNALQLRAGSVDELVEGLRRLGALLHTKIPSTGDNPDEIPDAPRVRA